MFCASTNPLPDAATDFSFRCPVMTFSSFSPPVEPTIEADDDGLALGACDRADELLADGEVAGADAELAAAVGGSAGELTAAEAGEAAGGGELVTGVGAEFGALDAGAVDWASCAGRAVQAEASTAIRIAAAGARRMDPVVAKARRVAPVVAKARRMAPILADADPATRPIGTRAPDRFDPPGRWSVLLGAARSCAPTSARPSHPFRVLSCCGETSSTTRFTAGRSSRCTRSFAAAAGSTR